MKRKSDEKRDIRPNPKLTGKKKVRRAKNEETKVHLGLGAPARLTAPTSVIRTASEKQITKSIFAKR